MSKQEQEHPCVCLLVNGGYFYFDVLGVLCGITAITVDFKSSATIEFGPSVLLDQETAGVMVEDLKEFWQPITIDFMLEKGASHYAWIRPGLTYGTSCMNMFGAFAYRFKVGSEHKDRIFPILPTNA